MADAAKILVVDDDLGTRKILTKYLKKDGFEVFTAVDGQTGFNQALEVQPQLIICDWMMPGMNGPQFCKLLKEHPSLKETYFIFLTAMDKSNMGLGIDTGADDFITKPIDYAEVGAKVRAGLRIVQAQQHLVNLTIRDELTGAFNRRYFENAVAMAVEHALHVKEPFILVILDLDNFKFINDRFGHLAGDKVLQEVVHLIQTNLTGSAILARIGGDEFACLLYFPNDQEAASFLEDRRRQVQDFFVDRHPDWPVSFSFGCATFTPEQPCQLKELFELADRELYKEKHLRKGQSIIKKV
jgi:two-component system chemotaxis response regulator CheY